MLDVVGRFVSAALLHLVNLILFPLYTLLDAFLNLFATSGALRDLLHISWVNTIITGGQVIAMSILSVRLGWEAFQLATLRAEGAPTDVGALIKKALKTAVAIFAGPHVVRQGIIYGNLLARWVASLGIGYRLEELSMTALLGSVGLKSDQPPQSLDAIFLVLIVGSVFLCLIYIQALIRTVEVTMAAIISPFAGLGYMSGGGMAEVWFRDLVILVTSHAVQMLLLYISLAFLFSPSEFGTLGPLQQKLYFIACLWVSFRTPKMLRTYAYSSGMGEAAGSVSQQAITRLVTTAITRR